MKHLLIKRLLAIIFCIGALLTSFTLYAAPNPEELFATQFSEARREANSGKKYASFSITNKGNKDIDDIIASAELVDAGGNRISFMVISDLTPGRVWLETGKSRQVSFPLDAYPKEKELIDAGFSTAKLNIKINKINFINELDDSGKSVSSKKKKERNLSRSADIVYDPIYERICQYGHPIFVTGSSLDKGTRFVHFKNSEYEKNQQKNAPYFYIALNNEDGITTQLYYSDLEQYKEDATYDEDLKKLNSIPIITHVSAKESDIANVFGKWDYKHKRKNGYKIVFAKPFCFHNKLLFGFYYEMENGSMKKTSGIGTRKGLISDIHDYRTFKGSTYSTYFNDGVHHYGDEPQLKNGPIDNLLDFILFKEMGDTDKASGLLTDELRNNQQLYGQTEAEIEINTHTLTYQANSRDKNSYKVLIKYSLKNGKSIKNTYEMLFVDGRWRVSQ
ncbi:MAG: hypothetical protein V4732_14605 [Pseudomonadota bacterium]